MVFNDARQVVETAIDNYREQTSRYTQRISNWMSKGDQGTGFAVTGSGAAVGLLLGIAAGSILLALIAAAHALVTAAVFLTVRMLGLVLRGVDSFCHFIYGVTSLSCPNCARKVLPYPSYRCPTSGCGAMHTDIRPGRLGFVRRVCRCGNELPTTIFNGAHKLDAFCPHCGHALPHGVGTAPEIVLAFVGAAGSGKTRLMYGMIESLQELDDEGVEVECLGDTAERLTQIKASITHTGNTGKTLVTTRPKAYGLRLGMHGGDRLLYLFDAAGEQSYRTETSKDLGYLDKMRILILVIDPLAADSLWSSLPPVERARLARLRSESRMELVTFDQTYEQLQSMGVRAGSVRLALVVTKADLLTVRGETPAYWPEAKLEEWVSTPDGLDLGDLVRSARRYFKDVEFFCTAAVTDEEGNVHRSVAGLVQVLLEHEGVTLRRPARAG